MATKAPKKLSKDQVSLFTKAFKSYDQLNDKTKNQLDSVRKQFPEEFKGINPVPLKSLSQEEQEERMAFVQNFSVKCEISDSTVTGKEIKQADPCKDDTFGEVESTLNNFFDKITGPGNAILNMPGEIKNVSNVIQRSMSGFVNKMGGALTDKLEEVLRGGFDQLANSIFATVSKSFPMTAAIAKITGIQESLLGPIENLFSGVFCVSAKIGNAIGGMVADLITSAINSVVNLARCAVQEIMGALTARIANIFDAFTMPLLGPIQKILGFAFNVRDFLLGGIDILGKIGNLFSCGDEPDCPTSNTYVNGAGQQKSSSEKEDESNFEKVFSGAALSEFVEDKASAFEREYGSWGIFNGSKGENSAIGPCDFGPILKCGLPKVEIFGGGGSGGAGKVILGNFLERVDVDDIYGDIRRTAGIVGVELIDPGKGYVEEPFVTFSDNCKKGYGAYGRANIDQNPSSPTYGQITGISMIATGENYPAEEEEVPLFVDGVVIENPGEGYEEGDTLENFDLTIVNGRIVDVGIVNRIAYDDLPDLNINTDTGFGAKLRPLMSKTRPQGEVLQVIDCIGKI